MSTNASFWARSHRRQIAKCLCPPDLETIIETAVDEFWLLVLCGLQGHGKLIGAIRRSIRDPARTRFVALRERSGSRFIKWQWRLIDRARWFGCRSIPVVGGSRVRSLLGSVRRDGFFAVAAANVSFVGSAGRRSIGRVANSDWNSAGRTATGQVVSDMEEVARGTQNPQQRVIAQCQTYDARCGRGCQRAKQ